MSRYLSSTFTDMVGFDVVGYGGRDQLSLESGFLVAGDRYDYLQIRYADIHADISADIYLHNFVHIGISADIPSICRYGTLSADIALYLQIWYVLQIYIE